jgi:hypothetical protein
MLPMSGSTNVAAGNQAALVFFGSWTGRVTPARTKPSSITRRTIDVRAGMIQSCCASVGQSWRIAMT